jgi:hypothetical protein
MIDLNFWAKINFDGPIVKPELGPCWLYTGGIDKRLGYGLFTKWHPELQVHKTYSAHRYAFRQYFGFLPPPTIDLDHLCRVRHCCNPWHTEVVSHQTNVLRGNSKQAENARKTHCFRCGEPLVQAYGNPKARHCLPCARKRATIWMRAYRAQKKLEGG